jgi:quercetin dioxygenase-like cupin family protein
MDAPPGSPPLFQFFGRPEGAGRVWLANFAMPPGFTIGLHRHEGDEIFRVVSGSVRIHAGGTNSDFGSGQTVVVPPGTVHGFRILEPGTELVCTGEIEMGEWVTVIDPDGSRREVEVLSTLMPWQRPPAEGDGMDLPSLIQLFSSTESVLDQAPEGSGC